MNTRERAHQILHDLESVREHLLALSDDIWLSIDHNDPEALQEGIQLKQEYNEKMARFETLTDELSALIRRHLDERDTSQSEAGGLVESERVVRALDKREPHSLDEDFTYKRPYGFTLEGRAYLDLRTWRTLYVRLCQLLVERDREHFLKQFGTHNQSALRSPYKVTDDIFVETHYSANAIRDNIRALLEHFDIDPAEFVVYLREDRDAE